MNESLSEELLKLAISSTTLSPYEQSLIPDFLSRLKEPNLVRDENPISHFSVYVWPFNPQTNQVFLTHHKKSGLWIAPGGHIDLGELPHQTVVREAKEELGITLKEVPKSFMFSIVDIEQRAFQTCRKHYDIWYLINTNGKDFNVDPREFHDTGWFTLEEAKKIVVDPSNIAAIKKLETIS